MKHLHDQDLEIWKFAKETAHHYAEVFGLRLKKISPLPRVEWGICCGYCCEDGEIHIGFRRSGTPEEAHQIVDTLSHELAHLAHMNHDRHWAALHGQIFSRMANDGVLDKAIVLCDSRDE